jgi:molybdopterin molybdotransferase
MVTVAEAERIISAHTKDFGVEQVGLDKALGRTLAENIYADRDLPPYNRVTMDGIAISYSAFEKGIRTFSIRATQAAGDTPEDIQNDGECIEIMTGAAIPATLDTVVRYEDTDIKNGTASVTIEAVRKGQNIHRQGEDRKQDDVVLRSGCIIDATAIGIAATVGMKTLPVRRNPKVIILSTGDELVDIEDQPKPYQVRRSNSYSIKAVLQNYQLQADMQHLPDDPDILNRELKKLLEKYDVLILSGGISKGKFDYVPEALEALGVNKLFHGVKQRPGKPFWFGAHERALVFAFPGNPVAAFMCLHRYFLQWHFENTGLSIPRPAATLTDDFTFNPALQYFLQVHLHISDQGQLLATPLEGHGSGDLANLVDSNAFMELPLERTDFMHGEIFRVWPFKNII